MCHDAKWRWGNSEPFEGEWGYQFAGQGREVGKIGVSIARLGLERVSARPIGREGEERGERRDEPCGS